MQFFSTTKSISDCDFYSIQTVCHSFTNKRIDALIPNEIQLERIGSLLRGVYFYVSHREINLMRSVLRKSDL